MAYVLVIVKYIFLAALALFIIYVIGLLRKTVD